MAELTPMMQQYMQTKKEYPDCILFYRLGDFYEMFFDDALTASKELEITLTGKNCGLKERAPMCGVPYHAVEGYLNRLVSKGYKNIIDRFNTEYEGKYHVTPITTNLEEYDGKLNALIAAGQTPDVYICNPGPNMDVYVNAGAAADLTDILENQEKDWYATFTDGIFDRLTYDGKIMAVPTNFAAACVYYNTELFEKAGVEVPTTYDELIDVCKKLQDAGITPISCSAGTAWCLSMIAGYLCDRSGVDLQAIADHTANWTDDNCIAAGEKLKELSQYFQETAAGDSSKLLQWRCSNAGTGIMGYRSDQW